MQRGARLAGPFVSGRHRDERLCVLADVDSGLLVTGPANKNTGWKPEMERPTIARLSRCVTTGLNEATRTRGVVGTLPETKLTRRGGAYFSVKIVFYLPPQADL